MDILNKTCQPFIEQLISVFFIVYLGFFAFFSKKLQTHLKADMVVMSSLAINVLEKSFQNASTVFDYFDPENFIFGIIVTILIFFPKKFHTLNQFGAFVV